MTGNNSRDSPGEHHAQVHACTQSALFPHGNDPDPSWVMDCTLLLRLTHRFFSFLIMFLFLVVLHHTLLVAEGLDIDMDEDQGTGTSGNPPPSDSGTTIEPDDYAVSVQGLVVAQCWHCIAGAVCLKGGCAAAVVHGLKFQN